jgi:hypothetical protein
VPSFDGLLIVAAVAGLLSVLLFPLLSLAVLTSAPRLAVA